MRLLTVVTLWLLARCSSPKDVDGDELGMQQVVSCGHEPVRLHCISQHHQMTAVTEAWFYETAHVCTERPPPPPQPPSTADTAVPRYSLLDSFNARCSGRRHCTFRLREDHPNVWRPGVIFVRYRCIGREDVTRYCSEVVTAPHGYLTNPGYPRYYPGQVNCTWHLRAHPGQHLRLRVHDLDVRGVPQGSDTCTDYLRVSEGRRVLSLACGVLREPLVVSSRGPELTVTLWGHGQPLLPHRGALIHFTAVGCPTPAPPRDGYLVFRNATHVLFSCCVNFVFGDTLQKERLLRCQDGRGWSLSLPAQCIEVRLLMEFANDTVRRELEHQLVTPPPTGAPRPVHTRTHTLFVDTILPILILVGLMLGNCVIVAVIMKYRRRDRDHRERGRGAAGRTGRELVDLSDPDPRTV